MYSFDKLNDYFVSHLVFPWILADYDSKVSNDISCEKRQCLIFFSLNNPVLGVEPDESGNIS